MAFCALRFKVLAEQGKFRFGMIETGDFPVLFGVALFAFFAFLPLMLVVLLVARIAGRGQLFLIQNTFVASNAFHLNMFAVQ